MPLDQTPETSSLERCNTYVLQQLRARRTPGTAGGSTSGPAITISHQTGTGAHEIAERLAGLMESSSQGSSVAWTVFDRQLVEEVLKEHNLPQSLAAYIPEDRRSALQDTLDELLGSRIPSWTVVPQIAETVLRLADAGRAILVGRGASVITADLPNVFHVRLIGSLSARIARVERLDRITTEEAAAFVKKADRARGRYVKAHFHVSVEDDALYHLIINTDRIALPEAAWLIAEAAQRWFQGAARV